MGICASSVGILFVGVSLVLRAALGAETVAERLVTAAVGLLATLSAWAVLKQPRSRRTEDDGAMLHVAEEGAWREARRLGRYAHPSGVVHGCSRAQLRMLVDAHVPDLAGRVVLTIDPAEAAGEVRWSTHVQGGRTERFPHLHGSISAVGHLRCRVARTRAGRCSRSSALPLPPGPAGDGRHRSIRHALRLLRHPSGLHLGGARLLRRRARRAAVPVVHRRRARASGARSEVRRPRRRRRPWSLASGARCGRGRARDANAVVLGLAAGALVHVLRRCAVFLGPAGKEELQALGPAAVEAIRSESGFEGEDWRQYLDALDRDGSPTAYAFRCGQCGRVGGYSDCD